MGLDLKPIGKSKVGYEERFEEIVGLIFSDSLPEDKQQEILQEYLENQVSHYKTIRAPYCDVNNVSEAIREYYESLGNIYESFEEFLQANDGHFIAELAKEKEGIAIYKSAFGDGTVFRGQYLEDCVYVLGEDLVEEAWHSKTSRQTLDYGNRVLATVEKIAKENKLEHLKDKIQIPKAKHRSLQSQVHIAYSFARWLIFYGKNGHGYEVDY